MSEDLPWWGVWSGAGGKSGYGLVDPVQTVALKHISVITCTYTGFKQLWWLQLFKKLYVDY